MLIHDQRLRRREAPPAQARQARRPARARVHQRARLRGLRRLRREVQLPVGRCRSRPSSGARRRSTRPRATRTTRASRATARRSSTIVPGSRRPTRAVAPAPPADLPEPELRVPRRRLPVRMPGIGGTGVVTVSQILQMAALLDGKHCCGLDQTGLAQKGGPVDLRRAHRARPDRGLQQGLGRRAPTCCSASTCSARRTRRTCAIADPERTVAVVSTRARCRPAAMVTDTGVRVPGARAQRSSAIEPAHARRRERATSTRRRSPRRCSATTCRPTSLLLGAAYQRGCLPVSADAIEQAIRLNGAARREEPRGVRAGAARRSRARAPSPRRPRRGRPDAPDAAARPRRRDRRGDRAPRASCAGCSRSACPS